MLNYWRNFPRKKNNVIIIKLKRYKTVFLIFTDKVIKKIIFSSE